MIRISLRHIILPALLSAVVLLAGLHSALACPPPSSSGGNGGVRVDQCHVDMHRTLATDCTDSCASQSCHRSTAPLQDLAYPEYHTRRSAPHPLVHESFSQSPIPRAGEPVPTAQLALTPVLHPGRNADQPRQALISLRSVVLLH